MIVSSTLVLWISLLLFSPRLDFTSWRLHSLPCTWNGVLQVRHCQARSGYSLHSSHGSFGISPNWRLKHAFFWYNFSRYTLISLLKDRVKLSMFLYKERGKFFDSRGWCNPQFWTAPHPALKSRLHRPSKPCNPIRKSSHAFAPLPGDQRNAGSGIRQFHPCYTWKHTDTSLPCVLLWLPDTYFLSFWPSFPVRHVWEMCMKMSNAHYKYYY